MILGTKESLLDQINLLEWSRPLEQVLRLARREDSMPVLPPDFVLGIFHEMKESQQRRMAAYLQLSFVQRKSTAGFPLMLTKSLHAYMREARHDLVKKRRLALALLYAVSPLLDEEGTLLGKEAEGIAKSDRWHYYGAVYFSSLRETDPERWNACLNAAANEAADGQALLKSDCAGEKGEAAASSRGKALPETILQKERSLRTKLEQETSQLAKALRQAEQKELLLRDRLITQEQRLEKEKEEQRNLAQQVLTMQQKQQEERARSLQEKENLQRELRGQQQEMEALRLQTDRLMQERERWQAIEATSRQTLQDPDKLMARLADLLPTRLTGMTRRLADDARAGADTRALRTQMRAVLDLLDALESCTLHTADPLRSVDAMAVADVGTPEYSEPHPELSLPGEPEEAEPFPYTGTFYRREHGGYIRLEHGEVFNITESIVNKLGLQHEAEVQCRPRTANGATRYEIDLLFQGDDSVSPVRQCNGYIELGEHFTYYCVDMNHPERRYPLHRKDVEMQQPMDGMPCVFNVSDESEFARISRLYHDFSPVIQRQPGREAAPPATEPSRLQRTPALTKPEPFLEGCAIAIVGGQRKWFEEVVLETGAELIHENGDRPDRLSTCLRRANALFLLITSTSHQASWDGVDLAKALGIPRFVIQGSKSNLRRLLWDNRQLIKPAAE